VINCYYWHVIHLAIIQITLTSQPPHLANSPSPQLTPNHIPPPACPLPPPPLFSLACLSPIVKAWHYTPSLETVQETKAIANTILTLLPQGATLPHPRQKANSCAQVYPTSLAFSERSMALGGH
jgi:hypothetical protein